MADSNDVLGLQVAVNRYSVIAGFGPIRPDGIVTPELTAAVIRALSWIAAGGSITDENDLTVDTTEPQQNQAQLLIVVTDQAAIRNDPVSLANFLNDVADSLGLTTQHSGTPGAGQNAAAQILNVLPASVQTPIARFAPSVPLWVKIGGIVGALGLVGWLLVRSRRSPRASSDSLTRGA